MIHYNDEISIMVDKYNCLAVLIDRANNIAFGPVIQGRFAEGIALRFCEWFGQRTSHHINMASLPDQRITQYYKEFQNESNL